MKKAARPAAKGKITRKRTASRPKKAQAAVPRQQTRQHTRKVGPRADFGAPIDGFFARQPPTLRPILEELRQLVDEAAPDATASIKWGMPFYMVGGQMMCALAGFKAHVNLILAGPPGIFADPEGLLTGDAKGGRHLKLRALDDLPRAAVRGWLKAAAANARKPA